MIPYPHIDPIAFAIGPVKIHWYGIMYLAGFAAYLALGTYRARKPESPLKPEQVGDALFYGALGVVLGGRIGYVLFYNLPFYLAHPAQVFAVWDGGMSFHGGMVGVILAMAWYARRIGLRLFQVTDFIAPMVPIGLACGRIGNFINGELWGKVTTLPWGMVFPNAGPLPRQPSQLYEFFFEGVVLFTTLWVFSKKPRPLGAVSGLFLLFYGIFRFLVEFVREPDPQLGYLAFGWVTMGQILSLPMILGGAGLLMWAYRAQQRGKPA
ncbi:prolipoprotein diacylglyceryl transferase [Acidihalobacter yilgarnensis]|uniref:Phosphatidylglycerol--prolipoprotein diacylglyceryl transferase n=1 Tax=Acidihalobacter yilgarnensis TaxID=2819280 RepID=A0A1D8IL21_9GAMM|nr:prolipoprotein diacylglyceryl transferase [Acidihalobacter yilgarnensis]AOU97172.1 prolipoprotein diacylglyceryl transferase [Acidihalobacter yilgarnensis]